ncbi:hypothetical protein Tco_1510564, partial [Tanacetum coccineum]
DAEANENGMGVSFFCWHSKAHPNAILALHTKEMPTTEATAQGFASMLCVNGPKVEWRICTVWEDA